VHLAHPLGVKAYGYQRVKTDAKDASNLADLLRMGRLPESWITPREIRDLREYKTELIKPRGPWRTCEQVEVATLDYVDWFNHRRLFKECGDIPPAELEQAHYRHNTGLAEAS
jgi:transposase InsO family protein